VAALGPDLVEWREADRERLPKFSSVAADFVRVGGRREATAGPSRRARLGRSELDPAQSGTQKPIEAPVAVAASVGRLLE
jgi:hypothetical protein